MKLLNGINRLILGFKKNPDSSKFKNILVVANSGLGDTILSTPAIISIKKSFKDINITFMVNKKMYPLFERFEYVNDFILYSSGIFNQLKIIRKIRNKNIDTVFLFHSNGPEDIFFSILGGANNILKATDNENHEFKSIFNNNIKKNNSHAIEKKLDLVKYYNPMYLTTEMKIPKRFHNQKYRYNTSKKIVGIQVGAQDFYKMWDIKNFIKIVDFLIKKNFFVVLFGSTTLEKNLTNEITTNIKNNNILNLCCKSKIEDLPSMINSIELLITNDTGIMHLAITSQVKTLSLFGPTPSSEFGAFQDNELHTIIQKDGEFVNDIPKKQRSADGINLISVKEVIIQINKILS